MRLNFTRNKAAVDSITGFDQDRRAKIASLCGIHRNRPYRPDVNFKIAALAATGAESDGGDENVTAGVLNGVALDLSTVVGAKAVSWPDYSFIIWPLQMFIVSIIQIDAG